MPIRLTASEGRKLIAGRILAPSKVRKPTKVSRKQVANTAGEADTTSACVGWLRAHGWRCIRLQSGKLRGVGGRMFTVGEKGLPDWMVLRCSTNGMLYGFFLEAKRFKGGVVSKNQTKWQREAKLSGFRTCVANSLESMTAWMHTEGL